MSLTEAVPTNRTQKSAERQLGYPPLTDVEAALMQRIERTIKQNLPVYRAVSAKLHNIGQRKTAALLQVFGIATKIAIFVLKDLKEHQPQELFAASRKDKSFSFDSDKIATIIRNRYHAQISKQFTINSSVLNGLYHTIAAMIAAWLHRITEAEEKGLLAEHAEAARFEVPFGKHKDKCLGELGRDVWFGYAFLQPSLAANEELAKHLRVLINKLPEDVDRVEEAEQYRIPSAKRKSVLFGTMRPTTLNRLLRLTELNIARTEINEQLRIYAQRLLTFTPPSFPQIKQTPLNSHERTASMQRYFSALESYGRWVEEIDHSDEQGKSPLAITERTLFVQLQKQAFEVTQPAHFIELNWQRADFATHSRDCSLLYDPAKQRYLFA